MRGPVFDHAEYGLLVLPSYPSSPNPSDRRLSWHWLMGVNRVLSKVFKSLVLVYVDIPSATVFEQGDGGLAGVLGQYKVREMMVKRWSSNRNRDVK